MLGQCFVWVRQYSRLEHPSFRCFVKNLGEIFTDILLLVTQEPGIVPFITKKISRTFPRLIDFSRTLKLTLTLSLPRSQR